MPRRMKIAIVIYRFSPTRGGAEGMAYQHVKGLVKRGHEVHLFSHERDHADVGGQISFHEVPAVSWYSPFKHLSFASNVKKLLLAEPMGIIHSFSRTYHQDIYRTGGGCHIEYLRSMEYAEKGFFPRLFSKMNPKEAVILRLEKAGFQEKASRVITSVSKRCKEEIMRNYGVPDRKIRVVYNGVDLDRFHPKHRRFALAKIRALFGFHDDDILMLFCGSGFKRKGLGQAIEAMAHIPRDKKVRLLVVGRDNVGAYRSMVHKLKIKDRVFFLGPRDHIHEYYAACDLLLHPSLYDPFPNVCLEAMASGIPVVTTKITGVAEIIDHGKDSLVMEREGDVADIVNALNILLDKGVRERMGAEARAKAERFPIERCIDENIKIYDEIVAVKGVGV